MGAKQKIAELERRLKSAEERSRYAEELYEYVMDLAKMPDDAVLYFTVHNMRTSHQIGKSARCLLEKLNRIKKDSLA